MVVMRRSSSRVTVVFGFDKTRWWIEDINIKSVESAKLLKIPITDQSGPNDFGSEYFVNCAFVWPNKRKKNQNASLFSSAFSRFDAPPTPFLEEAWEEKIKGNRVFEVACTFTLDSASPSSHRPALLKNGVRQ